MRKKSVQTYLVKSSQSSCYHFRMTVPPDLHALVGRKELRYSTQTGTWRTAKRRARKLSRDVKALFKNLRKEGTHMTKSEIDRLLKQYVREMLGESEDCKRSAIRPMTPEQLEDQLDALSFQETDFREQLALNDYRPISAYADNLIREKGIDGIIKESEVYRYLCRELLKAHINILQVEQKRVVGDYSDSFMSNSKSSEGSSESESIPLSQLTSLYINEQEKAGSWKPKSKMEFEASIALFIELFGDMTVNEIDHTFTRRYKEVILILPPNVNKTPKYRDLSVQEVIEMVKTEDNPKSMSIRSINKKLIHLSQLFSWAVRHGHMVRNPAEGLKLKDSRIVSEERAVYTLEDLKTLFHSKEYVSDSFKHSYMFWIPIIALFSGMRLTEIAQLHLDDIYQVDDTWVFDVNAKGNEGKRVKTKSSIRLVPIHDCLIKELNFISYVEKLKHNGKDRLFPELINRRDGYGQTVSKWYARYRKRCGVDPKDEQKDFHSYRHTFINTLKQLDANPMMLEEIVGHEHGSMTHDRYGKAYNPKILKEKVIDKLQYEIDLNHLRNSKYTHRYKEKSQI